MSFESVMAIARRLSVSAEALAALGAELGLRLGPECGDPQVRALLKEVIHSIDPQLLDDLDKQQQATVRELVRTVFRQAHELLENPARPPGWTLEDPAILQSQGQLSRVVVRCIEGVAAEGQELRALLVRPGVFLDVGTGVGWLAIEAARTWPALRVVGLDTWEPALAIARQNLAGSDVAERVELRTMSIEDLDEAAAFSLAWLPGPFIGAQVADRALAVIHRALRPGGWLIFGINASSDSQLDDALTRLRTVRSGGYPWTAHQVEECLKKHQYIQIDTFATAAPIRLVTGKRAT
jgi:SAM-dependent methyltransferase